MGSDDTTVDRKDNIPQIMPIGNIENIKSKYILEIIFNNLKKNKWLKMIKYNKKIQIRLDININYYKDFSKEIEIEIVPFKNVHGKFINIIEKEKEPYYHIYFNNNTKEIKRTYLEENDEIKNIKIIIDYPVESFERLFSYCECIESINFKRFHRNNIKNMSEMFYRCSSLKRVNLNNYNTENVTNMERMFSGCSSLKKINLSKFNTNKVMNMKGMFSDCWSLKGLDISNFNTNKVIDMSYMFSWCSSLTELYLSNFNTDNVTNMSYMFSECSSLIELDLSSFNTNNVIDIKGMFYNCSYKLQKKKIKPKYKNIRSEAFDYK